MRVLQLLGEHPLDRMQQASGLTNLRMANCNLRAQGRVQIWAAALVIEDRLDWSNLGRKS